ncbi:hypothetical protein AN641_01585 [Candidatus Epulonipiscioides gigas]|nr:hypothetical protein AN641_01585 [Epulopiscium sp. SCG-C07WGA-EpuloA2]
MSELYPLYRDDKSVEETIKLMKSPGYIRTDYGDFISGDVKLSEFTNNIYFDGVAPIEVLESIEAIWQAAIDKVNAQSNQ